MALKQPIAPSGLPPEDAELSPELKRALATVPRGAFAVCGVAVALLFIAWLIMYFGVFLQRGPVS
jgi:hypothetical protein